ncbi:MAG: nucleoside recognition domain-containing protein [Bacillota bacterium]
MIIRGCRKGFDMTLDLAKTIVPVFIFVTFLKHTPVLPWLARLVEPLMGLMGLPGEASLALVFGMGVSFYAGLGAIVSLDLTAKQMTVIGSVLLIAHSLPVETAVSKKTGVAAIPLLAMRMGLAFLCGIGLNLII